MSDERDAARMWRAEAEVRESRAQRAEAERDAAQALLAQERDGTKALADQVQRLSGMVAALRELARQVTDFGDLATARLMQVDDHYAGAWDHKDEMALGQCLELAHRLLADSASVCTPSKP